MMPYNTPKSRALNPRFRANATGSSQNFAESASVYMHMRRFIWLVTIKVKAIWSRSQNCWHAKRIVPRADFTLLKHHQHEIQHFVFPVGGRRKVSALVSDDLFQIEIADALSSKDGVARLTRLWLLCAARHANKAAIPYQQTRQYSRSAWLQKETYSPRQEE